MKRTRSFLLKNIDSLTFFLLALLLRVLYVSRGVWTAGDSYDYLAISKNIAYYFSFSFGETEATLSATAFRPPLYPVLLSTLYWTNNVVNSVLFLQAILGALTVLALYVIAKRNFGRSVAILSALLLTLEPFTIHYTARVMSETLFTLLVITGVLLIDFKKYTISGVVFGLAMLTRPTVAPFLAALVILSLFSAWSKYRKKFAQVFVFAILIVSFWTIRNALVFQEFIPVSTTGYGYNLLCGTMDVPMLSDEGWATVKKDPAIQQRRVNIGKGWTESEADRELFREALRRIYANPLQWFKVRVKQYIRLYIDSAPYILGRSNMRFEDAVQSGHWFFILFKLLLVSRTFIAVALSVVAIILLRKRFTDLTHIILFPIYMMLIHIPMWTENRYLLPIAPFICILASYGFINIYGRIREAFVSR